MEAFFASASEISWSGPLGGGSLVHLHVTKHGDTSEARASAERFKAFKDSEEFLRNKLAGKKYQKIEQRIRKLVLETGFAHGSAQSEITLQHCATELSDK